MRSACIAARFLANSTCSAFNGIVANFEYKVAASGFLFALNEAFAFSIRSDAHLIQSKLRAVSRDRLISSLLSQVPVVPEAIRLVVF